MAGKKALIVGIMLSCMMTQVGLADMIILEGLDTATETTGDLLDGTRNVGITVGVKEIAGLLITARSGGEAQTVNALSDSFGIDSDGSADDSDAFDLGEAVTISFNRDIRINLLDFNLFDNESESFTVVVSGMAPLVITYADLSNKTSGFYSGNIVVAANTDIGLFTTGPTPIGLDGMDVDVIPEPTVLGLISCTGIGFMMIRRFLV